MKTVNRSKFYKKEHKSYRVSWSFALLFLLITGFLFFPACKNGIKEKSTDYLKGDSENGGIQLPKGFSALIVADSLGRGRHIAVAKNGDIYLRLRQLKNGKGTVALRDTNKDGKADIIRYFGNTYGTGVSIHEGYIYVSDFQTVLRYKKTESRLLPDTIPEIIAAGFPEQNQHRDKPFTFDDRGNMYVNVGAPSNACMVKTRTPNTPGTDPCPQLKRHAGIWRFNDSKPDQKQVEDGYRYASGIRNSIALRWNFAEDNLYVVQHGRDQLFQFFPELYSEEDGANLPAEELLLVEDGSDFGWPYCYYDLFKKKKVLGPEYGGDGEKQGRCKAKDDPVMAFPAHMAPNDILFYTGDMFPERYKNGAFIAFHGSWNRAPLEQKGYFVVFVPFKKGLPSGNWEVFADGFAGTQPVMSPGDAIHRPVGLAQGPDGSLYVSDSRRGTIWRIFYHDN